ncbi:MAG: aspartate-semialdehyde dehydrogenase [Calditrichaeota bacterium]|nr:aspartate-semialdehyde dehydrogenase [Calditrichota bacterium]
MPRALRLAIVGATGLVGQKMLEILLQREIEYSSLRLFASKNSAGKKIAMAGEEFTVEALSESSLDDVDIALFSAGSSISKQFGPIARQTKTIIIDNSSAWRMDETVPLVVPEINGEKALDHQYIIANPNCSTIQMVMVLKPLEKKYGIKRVVVSTYQSVTGSGKRAVDQLHEELSGKQASNPVYPYPIAFNALPHIDSFEADGYTKEERKMINETRKIMGNPNIQVSPTCVRIPTQGGHSESINLELDSAFELDDIRKLLSNTDGLLVIDQPEKNKYPTPLIAEDTDDVYVGRIRRDQSIENGLHLWVVSDNLRKGAATNAVQILEYLLRYDD